MDAKKVRETFDKLPPKRKQVLLRVLAGESKTKIACEVCDGSSTDAVQQHLRQLYKNFHIRGHKERNLPALVALLADYKHEFVAVLAADTLQQKAFPVSCSVDNQETWVGREELIAQLSQKVRVSCRVLILTGITGIGKTALAERLALELQADWQLLKVNFDDGTPRDFTSFADDLLTKLKETVTADDRKNTELLLNRLVQKLRDNRYLVQIDSLEVLLTGKTDKAARNEFQDERWWEFFNRLLAGQDCQSRLILTSQDLPTQFVSCKYSQRWTEKPLNGLDKGESFELFQKLFQREGKAIESEAAGYLEQMGKVYEGHPLVIEVIAGEILTHIFNGNVTAYWHRYRQEFEGGAIATSSQMLELRVKDKVRDTLTRLKEDVTVAHTLLLRSSVYRLPVPELFWVEMLADFTSKEKATALNTLKYRRLVFEEEVIRTGESLLRQHNLIKSVAYELLEETDKKAAHYIAANMWRRAYEPEPDSSNLEKVRGYLEAFHHFCEVEDWENASGILNIHLGTPTNEDLDDRLGTWGYYQEQIQLYNRLLGKLAPQIDITCLSGLGNAYYRLGNYSQAIEYHKQSLTIAQEIGDRSGEGAALGNLGLAYDCLGNYSHAIEYYQQDLIVVREIGDRKGEGATLGNLGNTYYSLSNYPKAIKYHQQHLIIACEFGDLQHQGNALGNLGNDYFCLGNYSQAIEYHQRSLTIKQEIGDRRGEGNSLGNLGAIYYSLGNYSQAIEYHQRSLTIKREIGDRRGEGNSLGNLGVVYDSLNKDLQANEYFEQSLSIKRRIGDRWGEGAVLCNLGELKMKLQQYSQALEYLQTSLEIFRKISTHDAEATVLNNLAELHLKLGRRDLAFEYCDRALSIATELGIPLAKECQELKEKLLSEKA